MAKPIEATPVVKGKAAVRIQNEMRSGTPDTVQRVATIRRADAVYASATQAAKGAGAAKK
ncbi:MAG: hypothetical protein Q8N53_05705 [Longimicrobiales bacterium]|nr:hypothetical protein [Longimicrobiales bacterium]